MDLSAPDASRGRFLFLKGASPCIHNMWSIPLPTGSLGATLPPYLTLEMKVNKTGIKEYEKETGILPAGAEKVESVSLRIR